MINREPVISLDELKRRYNEIGPIHEYPGERTFAGRCSTFTSFLEYGKAFAMDLSEFPYLFDDIRNDYPGLIELVKNAWPEIPSGTE